MKQGKKPKGKNAQESVVPPPFRLKSQRRTLTRAPQVRFRDMAVRCHSYTAPAVSESNEELQPGGMMETEVAQVVLVPQRLQSVHGGQVAAARGAESIMRLVTGMVGSVTSELLGQRSDALRWHTVDQCHGEGHRKRGRRRRTQEHEERTCAGKLRCGRRQGRHFQRAGPLQQG